VRQESNLKADKLERVLRRFFLTEGQIPDARLLIWFAGYGHTIDGEGYLVPVDAPGPGDETAFKQEAVAISSLSVWMRQATARHILTVFDSCFSGTVFKTYRDPPLTTSNISRLARAPVRQMISSGEARQKVADDGVFRARFLDAISGRNPRVARDQASGFVTGDDVGRYLQAEISNATGNRQTGCAVSHCVQRAAPWVLGPSPRMTIGGGGDRWNRRRQAERLARRNARATSRPPHNFVILGLVPRTQRPTRDALQIACSPLHRGSSGQARG
jgi:hypothetical protein